MQVLDADHAVPRPEISVASFEHWSQPRYEQLLAAARGLLRPPLSHIHQPEDLVQEALFKAIKSGFSIVGREEPEIRGYLVRSMRLVHRVWCRYHNQKKRSLRRECSLERLQENNSGSVWWDGVPISDQTSPSGRAIRNEQSAALGAALAQLPPHLRQVVRMRKIDDLSVGEIAAVLGLSRSDVSRMVYLGTEELRDRISQTGRQPK